jgi:hypothetical protein
VGKRQTPLRPLPTVSTRGNRQWSGTDRMKTKAKPRTSKPKQLNLFDDPKPEPTIKARWRQPPHRKSEDPNWFWTWQAPATEDLVLRKRTLGW